MAPWYKRWMLVYWDNMLVLRIFTHAKLDIWQLDKRMTHVAPHQGWAWVIFCEGDLVIHCSGLHWTALCSTYRAKCFYCSNVHKLEITCLVPVILPKKSGFLASPDALEVIVITYLLTDGELTWQCDPGELWYLLKTWPMLGILMKMMKIYVKSLMADHIT